MALGGFLEIDVHNMNRTQADCSPAVIFHVRCLHPGSFIGPLANRQKGSTGRYPPFPFRQDYALPGPKEAIALFSALC